MKNFSADKLNEIYIKRRAQLANYMVNNNINIVIFEDNEEHRDANVRYFSGHINDAILIISNTGNSILIPWDINLAKDNAFVDKIIPFTTYERNNIRAIKSVLSTFPESKKQVLDISPATSYIQFLQIVDALPNWDIRCREEGTFLFTTSMREIKDEYEIACIKEAARIGDLIINEIESKIKRGKIKTETDVALFIESECRKHGCEKTGFDTLAAGPSRSYAIHCFPNYTNAPWPDTGLSILDFGVVYNGYTSDTTLTVAKGKLSKKQEELISLVEKAAEKGKELYKKDVPIRTAAAKIDEIFASKKRSMPHGLGHGIGLEIHESPFIRQRTNPEKTFQPGMIITLEPGLYDKELGGVRLENDILITEDGNEVISNSRIIKL